jgi:hypothetical protein
MFLKIVGGQAVYTLNHKESEMGVMSELSRKLLLGNENITSLQIWS